MLTRNPGVTLMWITKTFQVIKTAQGPLFRLGPPSEIVAYAEGRIATRDELDASITSGLPLLAEAAAQEGTSAVAALAAQVERAKALLDRMLPRGPVKLEGISQTA
jgi:hypothetical protein